MVAYQLGSTDGVPPNARAFRRFVRRHFPSLTIMLLAVMLVATFLFPFIVITVPSGQPLTISYSFAAPGSAFSSQYAAGSEPFRGLNEAAGAAG